MNAEAALTDWRWGSEQNEELSSHQARGIFGAPVVCIPLIGYAFTNHAFNRHSHAT